MRRQDQGGDKFFGFCLLDFPHQFVKTNLGAMTTTEAGLELVDDFLLS